MRCARRFTQNALASTWWPRKLLGKLAGQFRDPGCVFVLFCGEGRHLLVGKYPIFDLSNYWALQVRGSGNFRALIEASRAREVSLVFVHGAIGKVDL